MLCEGPGEPSKDHEDGGQESINLHAREVDVGEKDAADEQGFAEPHEEPKAHRQRTPATGLNDPLVKLMRDVS